MQNTKVARTVISDAVELLTRVVEDIRSREDKSLRDMYKSSIDSFLDEHRTVRLSLPRRMGNTTVAVRLGSRLRDSLIVVGHKDQAPMEYKGAILTIDDIVLGKGRGFEVATLISDVRKYPNHKIADEFRAQAVRWAENPNFVWIQLEA